MPSASSTNFKLASGRTGKSLTVTAGCLPGCPGEVVHGRPAHGGSGEVALNPRRYLAAYIAGAAPEAHEGAPPAAEAARGDEVVDCAFFYIGFELAQAGCGV